MLEPGGPPFRSVGYEAQQRRAAQSDDDFRYQVGARWIDPLGVLNDKKGRSVASVRANNLLEKREGFFLLLDGREVDRFRTREGYSDQRGDQRRRPLIVS